MKLKTTICLLLFPYFSFSQKKELDSLYKQIVYLHDSARVDCLNALSTQYIQHENRDSADYYSRLALIEAGRLNYIHGLASALSNQADILNTFNSDFSRSEIIARKAIHLFDETGNKNGLERTYDILGEDVFSQSKYEEAFIYAFRQYQLCLIKKDDEGLYSCVSGIGIIHYQEGNYDSAFYYLHEAQQIAKSSKNKYGSSNILLLFGTLYRALGNYPEALSLYRKVFESEDSDIVNERIRANNWETWVRMEYAELFSLQNQFDSAWHYYNFFDTSRNAPRDMRIYLVSTGETLLLQNKYHPALQNFKRGLESHRKLGDQNEIKRTLLDIAKTYYHLNRNDSAIKYSLAGIKLAVQTRSLQFIRDGYEILYLVYDRLKRIDSAYKYYQLFNRSKDAVAGDQVKGRLAAFNFEQKIEILNNEKQINQQRLNLERHKLEGESRIKNILILCILTVIILGIFIFRNVTLRNKNDKLESERLSADLNRKSADLEMQALRAQMNPHFIFNCLNSINRFILKNETEAASDYLTKFSRLIRMVLVNSKSKLISLDDELAMLKLYINMERLRFREAFDYKIDFVNDIDPENLFVPPLLLQPFVENAIWHGLMNKSETGFIEISFRIEQDNTLICTISDNGIGRKAASTLKSKSAEKQKSMGLQITKERIELMNWNGETVNSFHVEDLYDHSGYPAGTRVILKISSRKSSDAYA